MTLKNRYKESIRPKLLKELGLKNIHQVPKVIKVNVNRGLGEAASNSKALEASLNEMATITGQKALVTRAKKAIAGFKIREGMPIGCSVTLRGDRMYSFLERFINLALPRIREFLFDELTLTTPEIGQPFSIGEIEKILSKMPIIQRINKVQVNIKNGSDYANTRYEISGNASPDGSAIYMPEDIIWEIKYATDITGIIK